MKLLVLSYYEIRFTRYKIREICSTSVENSLQIEPFYAKRTQFQICQMNLTSYIIKRYVKKVAFPQRKNEPNVNMDNLTQAL